ncbi:DUF1259 domain-containing protein [Pseudomonas aeruginosa]|uniref:DUF1259 domain-containing protein n=1 Tax=Pseudomonas aeruginosa TaxID=287 RepID=A0AAQ3LLR5_PSEAI|nr:MULTISPECIES: DUF1259 domain-containing protein [Pseudomonadota]EIU4788368.1 DUF1259 domain-containing protein [Pseudomonas aeruginosa]EKX4382979.1 DUF1259 domain-containing protein [Pseudomonas aeruginosa]MCT9015385.1 DUF1259 domain-containing protein [Cupriavidus gilardii]MCT9055155.1 DUF1259 domain-containing protein [Cupriavidus gilardii]MDY7065043.1 hypothetical protein [Pseudomonas extremaustralis]
MHSIYRNALALAAGVLIAAAHAGAQTIDTAAIEAATGLKGSYNQAENVFKVSKPRDDVKISVDRWTMPAFMGLTSWAAFTPMGQSTMLMGDTVLFEDEVNPAMSAALDNGLEVTALHNHFFFDQPKVFFMHIGGMGDARKLAAGVKAVYDRIAQVRAGQSQPASAFAGDIASPSHITAAPIEQILGSKAQTKDGMVKVTLGRTAKMHGSTVGNEMGVNTWAAFAGDDEHAVVDGDFAMRENELQPVLKAMRGAGVNIVAIHQHMTHEEPRYVFLHYWGKGKALDLAKSVKAALDAQKTVQ